MKSGDGVAEKEEFLGEKLKRGLMVGKRVGPFACTPVRHWNRIASQPSAHFSTIDEEEPKLSPFYNSNKFSAVSARKLAAAVWEFQHYPPLSRMHRGVHINNHNHNNGSAAGDHRWRRHQNRRKDKALDLSHFLADPSPSSPDQVCLVFNLGFLRFD